MGQMHIRLARDDESLMQKEDKSRTICKDLTSGDSCPRTLREQMHLEYYGTSPCLRRRLLNSAGTGRAKSTRSNLTHQFSFGCRIASPLEASTGSCF